MTSVRSTLRQLVRRTGFDVVRYPLSETVQGHLRRLLDEQRISTVLDVGANRGQFGNRLRTLARFSGRIVSFEPDPDSFQALSAASAADPKWTAVACALGDRETEGDLQRFRSTGWNSLHAITDERLATSGRSITRLGSVKCTVRTVDSVWDEVIDTDRARVLLKSDTQGHEMAVLLGASDHLEDVEALLLELSVDPFYEGESDLNEVLAFVRARGFEPTGFFPVARKKHSLALDTVDVCFVRSRDQ